jgi:hypothetical protein
MEVGMIKNIFRGKDKRALVHKKGFHNPCDYCWKWKCKKCLVFILADFSVVLRSNPKLSKDFDTFYNKFHGNIATTRPERREMDRNAKTKADKLAKQKKALKVVK